MNDTIVELPVDHLHESPFNYRKAFSDAELQELAGDIRSQGRVLQPLLVRPRIPALFAGDPDATAGHEVVFGHRRLRAAALAGLETVPCMVRAMTDQEAASAQISENLQRVNVHPIEEAEGFQALIDNHGHTAETIVTLQNKSRSYVYARLKLLQACPAVRQRCLAGDIGTEVALLIARLRTVKLQEDALRAIGAKYIDLKDGGKKSLRDIRTLLAERYTLDTRSAMFDRTDATLLPAAGACLGCPKLARNAPEFADLAESFENRYGARQNSRADACTDPDCFAEKKRAHLNREAGKLTEAGITVVQHAAARSAVSAYGEVKGSYVAEKDASKLLKASKAALVPVVIQDPRTGKTPKAYKRADLVAAGVKVAEPAKKPTHGSYDHAAARREREELDQRASQETAVREEVLQRVRGRIASTDRSAADLAIVVRQLVLHTTEYDDEQHLAELQGLEGRNALRDHLPALSPDALARLLLDTVLIQNVRIGPYELTSEPEALWEAATHYGVDVDQVRAEVAAGLPTQSSAARAVADEAERTEPEAEAEATEWVFPAERASTPTPAALAQTNAAPAEPKRKAKSKSKGKALRADQMDDAGVAGAQADLLSGVEA